MKSQIYQTTGLFIITMMIVVFLGCGTEENPIAVTDSVISTQTQINPTDSPLVLTIIREENGQISVRSANGEVYNIAILEKVLDGEIPGAKIQTSSEGTIQAGPPKDSTARIYITDVTPWWRNDGVSITLTWDGLKVGAYWNGAWAIAYWTITEYEKQSGRKWPYHQRSRHSLAREIQAHCLLIFTPLWKRAFPIDMGFNETMWND